MGILEGLIKNNIKIPSPPGIAFRLLETLKADDFSFIEIAKIIQSDPALTTRVLRVVNSSFYSLPSKVSSIERALTIMGVNAIKNIALSFILINGLKSNSDGSFDFNLFWKKSITAAVSAELFAAHFKIKDEDIFVTALLQDIGVLVMCYCRPNDYVNLLEEKNTSKLPLEVLEDNLFGFNHQEVGSEILKLWGLPEEVYMPICFHHIHEQAPEKYRTKAKILSFSDKISSFYNDSQCAEKIRDVSDMLRDGTGISDSSLKALIDDVANKSVEIFSYFDIIPGEMKPFSQLLQEANEELSKLNLSYEMLLVELKQKNMEEERLGQELREANRKLGEMSYRDGLTGLYNRRYLDDFLDMEMSRSKRYRRCFSLLMIDIDHFKKINDSYGHQVGDLVLKALSAAVVGTARETDIVARYGGEEFSVVLPETDMERALITAERFRKVVEGMDMAIASQTIKITISVGVASFTPQIKEITISRLMEMADRALYSAKNSGRNRVVSAEC